MMFCSQFPRQLQHIDAFIVFHARQRLRAKPFLGKEIESCAAHPIMYESIGTGVPSVTRLQAFFEDLIELGFECMNVPDAWRARRHPLGLLVPELEEIEIKSTIRDFLGACESLFRNREQRKA